MARGVEDDGNRSMETGQHHHQSPPPPPPPFHVVFNYPPPPQQQQQQPPHHGYPPPAQPNVPGYAVAGHVEHPPLPCCGLGFGWLLFILGFFFTIPWYIGLFLMLCPRNPREKPGLIACAVGSIVVTSIIILAVVSGSGVWS